MAFLLSVLPLGADNRPENSLVAGLVAELLPKSTESGFVDLVVSEARALSNLTDAVLLISMLITPGIKAVDTRALYVEHASILELLGRYEEAADSWEAAIAAQPGQGDPSWLLSAAACRLATGDIEAGIALSKAALLTTTKPGLVALALLVEARALMLAGDLASSLTRSRDALALGASGYEAAALSLAGFVSSGVEREGFEKRLKEEFSGWPESYYSLASIYYHLVNVDSGMTIAAQLPASASGSTVSESRAAESMQSTESRPLVSGPLFYQLGAFRDEANAALLSARLVKAGFSPKTVRRESRVGALSIVYLDAGPDPARSMIALKDAGFESWPLFAEP